MIGHDDAGAFFDELFSPEDFQVEEGVEEAACGAAHDEVKQGTVHVVLKRRKKLAGFEFGADVCRNEADDLVDAHIRCVYQQGIICLLERCAGALGVLLITLSNGIGDAFCCAAGGAHLFGGGDKVFELRFGEDDGADIAPFHDHGFAGVVLALLLYQEGADCRDRGDGGDVLIGALLGEFRGEDPALEHNGGGGTVLAEAQGNPREKGFHSSGIGRGDSLLQGVPGDRSVHGTRVDEGVAQLFGNEFGYG